MKLRKNFINKLLFIIVACAILLVPGNILTAQTTDIAASIEQVHEYYQQQTVMDEWEALAARWSGFPPAAELAFANPVTPSDYARSILGAIAADKDAGHINGLIDTLKSMQKEGGYFSPNEESSTTLNQTIWPLIALDFAAANNYDSTFDREAAVNYIISGQSLEGGFDESGWGVDVDSTAHALISLAPYQDKYPQIAPVVEQALNYLKTQQFVEGGFGGWGAVNPDTTAAVIEALISLGVDPISPEWVPGDKTMVDVLLGFQSEQGWFVYSTVASEWNDPTQPNPISTRNALLALGDLAAGFSKYQSLMPLLENNHDDDNPGGSNPGDNSSSSGRVFVTITGDPKTGIILPRQNWTWTTGNPTVMDALLGVLQKKDIDYNISSNGYVVSLGGLSEKQPGYPLSGWLYKVNGIFCPVGASYLKLHDGDEICWLYTLDGGLDVGNPFSEVLNGQVNAEQAVLLTWAKEVIGVLEEKLAAVTDKMMVYNNSTPISERAFTHLSKELDQYIVNLKTEVNEDNLLLVDSNKETIMHFSPDSIEFPIQVKINEKVPTDLQKSGQLISQVFVIDFAGEQLKKPAVLAIKTAIPPAVDPESVYPVRFISESQKWEPLLGVVDAGEGWVAFLVDSAGYYGVGFKKPAVNIIQGIAPAECKALLVEKGIIRGSEKGFEWERKISRAEMAQMLYCLSGSPVVTTHQGFIDVREQQWFNSAVNFMAEQRIMVGYPSGHFYPEGLVNRYQAAAIMYSWLQRNNVQLEIGKTHNIIEILPDWAAKSAQYMLDAGCMAPISGSFAGEQLLSREDAAVLICHALITTEQIQP